MPFFPRITNPIYSIRCFVLVISLFSFSHATAQAEQSLLLQCSAFGGSHTIRMSFLFHSDGCILHWREIDSDLEVILCEPPHLIAGKPYAEDHESRVHLHLESGAFMDQYGSMEELGWVKK